MNPLEKYFFEVEQLTCDDCHFLDIVNTYRTRCCKPVEFKSCAPEDGRLFIFKKKLDIQITCEICNE